MIKYVHEESEVALGLNNVELRLHILRVEVDGERVAGVVVVEGGEV